MKSALNFLLTARRREIDDLDQLARTGALVGAIGRLVHALQRERGASNVFLASGGRRFAAQRRALAGESLRLEDAVRAGFDALDADHPRHGARLFSRVAAVLPGLDALPALRERIAAGQLDAGAATAAFVKLVTGLLAVVFEAADGASDPAVSRALAAMFNFMQGKEFAGQERACGAAAFAAGTIDAARQQQWLQLIAQQERCFQVFTEFAGPALQALWTASQPAAELLEVERLRRTGCAAPPGAALDSELAAAWFDACSLRIDAMQAVEEQQRLDLQALCTALLDTARADVAAQQALLARAPGVASSAYFDTAADDATAPAGYGQRFERSVLEMLQEQSRRVQAVSDELQAVREALNERKLVERAKGLLMAHKRLSEPEAHKMLRQTAMNQNRRLVDVAESVLAMADYLPQMAPSGT